MTLHLVDRREASRMSESWGRGAGCRQVEALDCRQGRGFLTLGLPGARHRAEGFPLWGSRGHGANLLGPLIWWTGARVSDLGGVVYSDSIFERPKSWAFFISEMWAFRFPTCGPCGFQLVGLWVSNLRAFRIPACGPFGFQDVGLSVSNF